MNNINFFQNVLSRRTTRILSEEGKISSDGFLNRVNIMSARCIGIRPHGNLEVCAAFEFKTPNGIRKYRLIYENKKVSTATLRIGHAPKKRKFRKPHLKRRPYIIYTGGFETNRRKH